jgi:hypothetical protein
MRWCRAAVAAAAVALIIAVFILHVISNHQLPGITLG